MKKVVKRVKSKAYCDVVTVLLVTVIRVIRQEPRPKWPPGATSAQVFLVMSGHLENVPYIAVKVSDVIGGGEDGLQARESY